MVKWHEQPLNNNNNNKKNVKPTFFLIKKKMLELEEKQRETKVKSNVAQSPGNITAPRNMVLYWVTILPVYLGFGD